MFARPIDRKQSHKKKSVVQKSRKQTLLSTSKLKPKHSLIPEKNINKIASIRTLPAFIENQNAHYKSNQCFENGSDIWKEQYYLFQSTQKQSIEMIDKQLQDVLDTIRRQRNLIDMKIWKLKTKIHELHNRNQAKLKLSSKKQLNELSIQTQEKQSTRNKIKMQVSTQTYDPNRVTDYFKQYANQLGLTQYKDINVEQKQKVDEQTKIVQNKKLLEMLFDKIGNL